MKFFCTFYPFPRRFFGNNLRYIGSPESLEGTDIVDFNKISKDENGWYSNGDKFVFTIIK